MADSTVLVRPRAGIILDGIPATGAEIPQALADEWLADRLVVRLERPASVPSEEPIEQDARSATKRRRNP